MVEGRRKILEDALLIALLLVLLALPAEGWLARWCTVPIGDSAFHLLNVFTVQGQWLQGADLLDRLRPLLFWTDSEAYPPLGYVLPAAVGAVRGGLDVDGLLAAQVGWVGLAGLGSWWLGRTLFGRTAGILAALCTLFAPPLLGQLGDLFLDTASAAVIMLALAALASAWSMARPLPAVLAGLAVGCGLLTKWTALFYLGPALLGCAVGVLHEASGGQRLRLGGLLVLVAAALGGASYVARVTPPVPDPMAPWIPLGVALAWLGAIAAVAAALAGAGHMLLGAGPPRNLFLALLVSGAVAAPFYLWNLPGFVHRMNLERSLHQGVAYEFRHLWAPYKQANDVAPMGGLVTACALVWIAARGPRGSFALVAAPLAVGIGCHAALKLVDARYLLPAVPLALVAVSGWLQSARETRAVSAALLGAFGVWNLALWTGGLTPPAKPGPHLGTLPGSINARLDQVVEVLGPQLGPGPSLLLADLRTVSFRPESLQVAFLDRGFPVVVREVSRGGGGLHLLQTRLSVLRLLMLREPGRAPQEFRDAYCDPPLDALGPTHVLYVGTAEDLAERSLPGVHGPALELPAPGEGLVARAHAFRPFARVGPGGADEPLSPPRRD